MAVATVPEKQFKEGRDYSDVLIRKDPLRRGQTPGRVRKHKENVVAQPPFSFLFGLESSLRGGSSRLS